MNNQDRKKDEVNKFLGNFKRHLTQKILKFIPNEKNKQTLIELGFTPLDIKTELLRLVYKDYISGPEADDDPNRKGDIWKFGKSISKENIYIKIKLAPDNRPICLSFHLAERELKYFFK